eukprot:7561912-Lingulodinium_polyedra.AAC.1
MGEEHDPQEEVELVGLSSTPMPILDGPVVETPAKKHRSASPICQGTPPPMLPPGPSSVEAEAPAKK